MHAEFDMPYPHYRCPVCGKDLPPGEARITVSCPDHLDREDFDVKVRKATDADEDGIEMICDRALGETDVDVFGQSFDILGAVNLIAEVEGKFAGLLSLRVVGGEATVIFMSVYPEYQGAGCGTALLAAADAHAAERGLPSIRVAITNDDVPLMYFYQRHGFWIYDIAIGEVADRFGSATPGFASIPVRDEVRLRRHVCTS